MSPKLLAYEYNDTEKSINWNIPRFNFENKVQTHIIYTVLSWIYDKIFRNIRHSHKNIDAIFNNISLQKRIFYSCLNFVSASSRNQRRTRDQETVAAAGIDGNGKMAWMTTERRAEQRWQFACPRVKWTQTPAIKVTHMQIVPLRPLRKHYRRRPPNGFRWPAISMRYGVIAWIREGNDTSRRSLLGHCAYSNNSS